MQNAIADRLVFTKLRDRFGGRLRFFISGSAALSTEIAEFFHAANILVAEGYGLTETSAASFVNWPLAKRSGRAKFATVGPPMPGTEVKIAPEDGEVLLRGRGVMRGYHNLPDATRETIDPDGWLRTGDIGLLDDEGFLRLTDRKKDLIKTSGGKYVAPQVLEGKVKAACPYVNQVLVHGNNRNYCSALVTLDEDSVRGWLKENAGVSLTGEQMSRDEKVRGLIQGYVDQVNGALASYETIKKFAILPSDFSVDAGELTASLKVKRKVVEQKYKQVLDEFYDSAKVMAAH